MLKDYTTHWVFYFSTFAISISSGFFFGFYNSHVPPVPFLLGFVFFFIGLIWCIIDVLLFITRKKTTYQEVMIHLVGLVFNILFLAFLWTRGT